MEDSRPRTIMLGTLTLSMTSALATGIYGSFRKLPHHGLATLGAAFNSSITGLLFFTCREYVVSPALTRYAPWEQYARRRRELGIDSQAGETPDSLAASRYNQLLDSGISGVAVVGAFHAISRRPGAVRTMMTAGTVCTLLQLGYNELNVKRLQYISNLREDKASSDPQLKEGSRPHLHSFLSLLGIRPISEELYQERMQQSQDRNRRRVVEEPKVSEEGSQEQQNKT